MVHKFEVITNIIMEQIPSQDEKIKPKIYGSKALQKIKMYGSKALWQNRNIWFQSTLTKYMVPRHFDKVYGSKHFEKIAK